MNRIFKILPLLAVLFLFPSTGAQQAGERQDAAGAAVPIWEQFEYPPINNFEQPDLEIFTLNNGIRFYLVEDHELPLIEVNVIVRTGGILVPDGKIGLAAITGTVMRSGGTAKYPSGVLNELLEDRAAVMETGIGFSSGSASMSILSEDFDELAPVFVDLLQNPAFPEEQIELARMQQKTVISRRNDDQAGIANREFQRLIYGEDTPYARRAEYGTLDNIVREDLVDFHARSFVGQNMLVGVTGDFDTAQMKRRLESVFGSIGTGEALQPAFPEVNYDFPQTVNLVHKPDVNQSYVLLGHIGGLRSNPDYARLQVMNRVLSGGFSSRLMQVVRSELGLAYSVFGAYGSGTWYPGTFTTGVMTQSETTAAAISAIMTQIRRLQDEPISSEELEQTKDQFLNSLVFQYPSRSAVLRERMSNDYAGLPPDTFEQLVEEIRQVSIEDIQQMAQRYLRPDSMQILVVGNAGEIGEQLAEFGPVNIIDVSIPQPSAGALEAGDARLGAEWLSRMAVAILPGGSAGVVTIEAENKMSTPMGEMVMAGREQLDFAAMQFHSEVNTPQGQVVADLNEREGTLRMAGQELPLQGAQLQEQIQQYRVHYLNLASKAGSLTAEYVDEAGDGALVHIRLMTEPALDVYLDPDTALPVRSRSRVFNPQLGAQSEVELQYRDWREVDGVRVAYETRSLVDGAQQAVVTASTHSVQR